MSTTTTTIQRIPTPAQRIRRRWATAKGRRTKGQLRDHQSTAAPRYGEASLLHPDHRATPIWRAAR